MTLEKLLCDLISIYSPTGYEKEISEFIEGYIKNLGFKPIRINNNILLEMDFNCDYTLALVGHIDTVLPSKENQTIPKKKNGKIYGLGACDMKAGLSVMLHICKEIAEKSISPKFNLKLFFYEGEEGPLPNGLTQLISKGLFRDVDFSIVLEPSDSIVEIGCLGRVLFELWIKGRASHSAMPWRGKNAIYNSLPVLNLISRIKPKKRKVNGMEFYETISVTKIETNNSTNSIPGRCKIYVDMRISPSKKSKKNVLDELKFILKNYKKYNIEKIKLRDLSKGCILEDFSLCEKIFGKKLRKKISQYWSDIAQLNLSGVPAVNFGPGKINFAHSPNEHITISELYNYYRIIKRIIQR